VAISSHISDTSGGPAPELHGVPFSAPKEHLGFFQQKTLRNIYWQAIASALSSSSRNRADFHIQPQQPVVWLAGLLTNGPIDKGFL